MASEQQNDKNNQKDNNDDFPSVPGKSGLQDLEVKPGNKPAKNKGTLKIDATVADQHILYPTDMGLLNKSREESERIIDILCEKAKLKKKPRTYRRTARGRN